MNTNTINTDTETKNKINIYKQPLQTVTETTMTEDVKTISVFTDLR